MSFSKQLRDTKTFPEWDAEAVMKQAVDRYHKSLLERRARQKEEEHLLHLRGTKRLRYENSMEQFSISQSSKEQPSQSQESLQSSSSQWSSIDLFNYDTEININPAQNRRPIQKIDQFIRYEVPPPAKPQYVITRKTLTKIFTLQTQKWNVIYKQAENESVIYEYIFIVIMDQLMGIQDEAFSNTSNQRLRKNLFERVINAFTQEVKGIYHQDHLNKKDMKPDILKQLIIDNCPPNSMNDKYYRQLFLNEAFRQFFDQFFEQRVFLDLYLMGKQKHDIIEYKKKINEITSECTLDDSYDTLLDVLDEVIDIPNMPMFQVEAQLYQREVELIRQQFCKDP